MNTINTFVHAYKQAPWRLHRQWVSIFLLTVIGFTLIATLYLLVTSRAAIVGREIQNLREKITETRRTNADLQTRLAKQTSMTSMEKRATALGFRPVRPSELNYLYVPGYVAPEGVALAAAQELKPGIPSIPQEYNQSLLDWLDEKLQAPSQGTTTR